MFLFYEWNFFFSIIIPVYNAAKFIDKCIKSIFNQEFDDVQVILINDCSTDGSREICNKYKKKYNLNLIEHKHRLGVAISRNDGIKIAKGKYIIFLDSDDFLINNCLIKLKKIILKTKFRFPTTFLLRNILWEIIKHIICNCKSISNQSGIFSKIFFVRHKFII